MKICLIVCSFFIFGQAGSGQTLLLNGRIPDDLKIVIDDTGTVQFADYNRFTISADGIVTVEKTGQSLPIHGTSPVLLALTGNHGKNKKMRIPKLPAKKDKVSERQLLELAMAVESSTFFEMSDRYHGNPTLELATCINHADAKAISVSANGKTKIVYFFLGCDYGDFEPLKKFLELYKKIETVIGGVKVKEIAEVKR